MRYRSLVADSSRWDGFELRAGDIVITTPPKCGTTWTQMLCALLIFDGPDFPAPLERLSPWVDMLNRPVESVQRTYREQTHRRFLKTHTPLDGLPMMDDVTYLVVGRDPRDVAISMEHHLANMNVERFLELRASAVGLDDLDELPPRPDLSADPSARFRAFITQDDMGGPATLAFVLHHLDTAWTRRDTHDVAMFHYADFQTDLPGELTRLAGRLGIEVSQERAVELAAEATLDKMRARADEVAPSASLGQWKDSTRFFRAGGSGEWRSRVTPELTALYEQRVAALVSPDLAEWAHLGRIASGIDPLVARLIR